MTVYVDLLFGINALINYLLLWGSAAIGGCPVKLWRLAAAAALGGLYALAVVIPGMEPLGGPVFQGVVAGVMAVTAFGWKRNTVKQGLFFLALSFAFGGVVLLAVQLTRPDVLLLGGRAYYAVSTPTLLLLAGLCYGMAAVVLSGCGTHTGGDIVPMTLDLEGRQVHLRALRDTGNTLRDPITGQPVLIAACASLASLLPAAADLTTEEPSACMAELVWRYPSVRFRLIPYRAVGVETGLLLAVRCGFRMKGDRGHILVAFSPSAVCEDGRFDAIWGGEIL